MTPHRQTLREDHRIDRDGHPGGGFTLGVGIDVNWQDGPVRANGQNGAQSEHLIQAVVGRLEFLQSAAHAKFACPENVDALLYLQSALDALDRRTAQREQRGVEGTHTP